MSARVAVVEQRVDLLHEEGRRTRERLHSLESDRATIKLLTRQVSELIVSCEKIAERAADSAVDKALEAYEERQKADRRSGLDLRAKWTSIGIATCGLAFAAVEFLLR